MGDFLPYSAFVPMEVAQQLTLQLVKKAVEEAGSREQYQQNILGTVEATPEQVWAVQQLGFYLLENIEIISP